MGAASTVCATVFQDLWELIARRLLSTIANLIAEATESVCKELLIFPEVACASQDGLAPSANFNNLIVSSARITALAMVDVSKTQSANVNPTGWVTIAATPQSLLA